MRFVHVILEHQRDALDALKHRLYTEDRMTGDEMRDAASMIGSITENTEPILDEVWGAILKLIHSVRDWR